MEEYSEEELTQALRAVDSISHNVKRPGKNSRRGRPTTRCLKHRLDAMYILKALMARELEN